MEFSRKKPESFTRVKERFSGYERLFPHLAILQLFYLAADIDALWADQQGVIAPVKESLEPLIICLHQEIGTDRLILELYRGQVDDFQKGNTQRAQLLARIRISSRRVPGEGYTEERKVYVQLEAHQFEIPSKLSAWYLRNFLPLVHDCIAEFQI